MIKTLKCTKCNKEREVFGIIETINECGFRYIKVNSEIIYCYKCKFAHHIIDYTRVKKFERSQKDIK